MPCPPDCPECQSDCDRVAEDKADAYPQPPTPRRREYLAATLRAASKGKRPRRG